MIRLSAFADEISPDLDEQIAVLQSEHIHYLDLRGVWNTNVLDLSDAQVNEIRRKLDAQSMAISAIASPIGKVPVDSSFDELLQRFERAITLAQIFSTPFIRIFSFYPPASPKGDLAYCRYQVLVRLKESAARDGGASISLLYDNERG